MDSFFSMAMIVKSYLSIAFRVYFARIGYLSMINVDKVISNTYLGYYKFFKITMGVATTNDNL